MTDVSDIKALCVLGPETEPDSLVRLVLWRRKASSGRPSLLYRLREHGQPLGPRALRRYASIHAPEIKDRNVETCLQDLACKDFILGERQPAQGKSQSWR